MCVFHLYVFPEWPSALSFAKLKSLDGGPSWDGSSRRKLIEGRLLRGEGRGVSQMEFGVEPHGGPFAMEPPDNWRGRASVGGVTAR